MRSLALALGLFAAPACATELGATNRGLGTDTVLIGLMGPPGSTFLGVTLTRYEANRVLDGSGSPRPDRLDFRLDATVFTVRMSYVWPEAKLFGADVETRLGFAGYARVGVDFNVPTPAGQVHVDNSYGDSFPGVNFAPVLLGWHDKTLHQIAGVQFFVPARRYRGGDQLNVTTGFASVYPVYWLTWLPNESIEVDASFFYLFNAKNDETGYRSGQEFSFDYAAGYNASPSTQVGVNGYFYAQTTDDTRNGNVVGDGNRGRAFAVGPFVRIRPAKNWGVVLKWQIETWAENRTRGNRFFVQFGLLL